MPKPRTKRGNAHEERKRKRADLHEDEQASKRIHREHHDGNDATDHEWAGPGQHGERLGEKEFFGMLADEEQEYFRRADEMLELNEFPSTQEREIFIDSVYREARGKELKLASSQSCSRLMERLIQLSNTAQKKHLFEAFAGHFLTLVRHRFASHCCEALFLRSAGVVTQELAGFVVDTSRHDSKEEQSLASIESLFLATLDELEGNMSFLLTDRFASHTLRVLLLVLSGRPLEEASAKALLKSKKKEDISVIGSAAADLPNQGTRIVPESFQMAVQKIIQYSTASLDATGLRVLAIHAIGNPTLQLLLELDIALNKSDHKAEVDRPSLLMQLLPGAPKSLADETSAASEFVNGMIYDQIGSRLIETLVTHCPGKIFRALNQNILLPRIQGYVRNDIASYPAIRVLNRLGKDDLAQAVDQISPTVPQLVIKARYNVLRALFERCLARGLTDAIKRLMKGFREGCGQQPADLTSVLCCLGDEAEQGRTLDQVTRNNYAIQSHGAQLLTTLLSIPGPAKGVQESLLALPPARLLRLANASKPTACLLATALSTPSTNAAFQKSLVGTLTPHVAELATAQSGSILLVAIAELPTRGKDVSLPCHLKEAVMQRLGSVEPTLRESWTGRSVWRAWRGDQWKTRRGPWKAWLRGEVADGK